MFKKLLQLARQKFHQWKWHEKVLYSIAFLVLILLGIDCIELAFLPFPHELVCTEMLWHGKEYGSEKLEQPAIITAVPFDECHDPAAKDTEGPPLRLFASHMSVFPWHRGNDPCCYVIKINRKAKKVLLIRKYMSFFFGIIGDQGYYEVMPNEFQEKLFQKSVELIKEINE